MKQVRMIVNVQIAASALYGFLIGCSEEATIAENIAGIMLVASVIALLMERAVANEEFKNQD